jgi:hypothetical protein
MRPEGSWELIEGGSSFWKGEKVGTLGDERLAPPLTRESTKKGDFSSQMVSSECCGE